MNNFKIPLLFSIILLSTDSFAAPSFTPDSQPSGWLAVPALSNTSLLSGNETIYLLNYDKNDWSGDVLAKAISSVAVVGNTGPWDPNTAATKLDTLNYDTGRKIVTRNGTANVPFRLGNLSTTQQTSLAATTTDQQKILNYVRGDRSNEAPATAGYRVRTHVLGDILHSTLAYRFHDASNKRLYIGANDGMLHVFNATDGSEIFAYIPSMVIPNLNKLINAPYVHTYFVDGGITISNVNVNYPVTTPSILKTFLVGGLGAGGKGLYALDVTTPTPPAAPAAPVVETIASETAAASKIKWEITPSTTGFGDLGYTYSVPRIARLNDGTAVAIVGNGYVNGGTGHAVLYIINLNTGVLIKAIDTGAGTTASPNGLSTPTLFDSNSDGKVDYAYAGDLNGNLWKFDLSSTTPSSYTATNLLTTSPAQAITSPPVVINHPSGGRMVVFATGKLLTTGDTTDATTVHYAYGIWDGQPVANNTLLTQTITTYGSIRTITGNVPDWTSGSGHHNGWKVALPAGERVTGELPFTKNGRFYFLTANPAVVNTTPPNGSNWLYELDVMTGGSTSGVIFDINGDGEFNNSDLATGCTVSIPSAISCIPVAKLIGAGVSSQPAFVEATNFNTTLFSYNPETTSTPGIPGEEDRGVSDGHFDFDNYYYGNGTTVTTTTPTTTSQTKTGICSTTANVEQELNEISPTYCTTGNGFGSTYTYMTAFIARASNSGCSNRSGTKKRFDITCNTVTTNTVTTLGDYLGPYSSNVQDQLHVHEYDDTYDVTGVNMLNASEVKFNLSKMITDPTTAYKVLLMNQYLNPAATISVGDAPYESVKTYKNLASATDATSLITSLPSYTGNTRTNTSGNIKTLIVNLPVDAFQSKDWWGDGGSVRSGLIPARYACVVYVKVDGSMKNSNNQGLIGPNGERFDGALTIQLIKANTPASALELNYTNTGIHKNGNSTNASRALTLSERARYGWRVKQSEFKNYVLGEYTIYWHHPNDLCYGNANWVPDAPQDTINDADPQTPAAGSADPTDEIFGSGLAVTSKTTTTSGNTTTTTVTYVDGTRATLVVVKNNNGSKTSTTTLRDGTTTSKTTGGTGTPGDPTSGGDTEGGVIEGEHEKKPSNLSGRQSWWEIF